MLDQVICEGEEEMLHLAQSKVKTWRKSMEDKGSTAQSELKVRAKELLEAKQRVRDSSGRERWASHLLSCICVASHT